MSSDPTELIGHHPQQQLYLDHLPPELLTQIFEYLIPIEPDTGEPRPVAYEQLIPEETWFELSRRQSGLRSTCLVSHQFYRLAHRFLYRRISIIDEIALVLLLRTLLENPGHGLETRYFSCHITLTEADATRKVRKSAKDVFKTLDPALLVSHPQPLVRYLSTLHNRRMPMREYDQIPQAIMLSILALVPKIEVLLLQIPLHDDDFEYTAMVAQFHQFGMMHRGEMERYPDDVSIPCQHLKKFILQGDPELLADAEEDAKEDGEPVGIQGTHVGRHWALFTGCPELTSVEVTLDDGEWPDISWFDNGPFSMTPSELRHVKHLDMVDSFAAPRDVAIAMARFPRLESLYFEPRWSLETAGWEDEDDVTTMDAALEQYGRNLRRLDLAWYECSDCLISLGDEGRITALPKLTQLEILYIQLALLFIDGRTLEDREVILDFSNLFPPSLVILVLEEWWWTDHALCADAAQQSDPMNPDKHLMYCASVEYSLLTFAAMCPAQLPKLTVVNFLVRLSRPWLGAGEESMEQRLAAVKAAFAKNGIQFSTWQI